MNLTAVVIAGLFFALQAHTVYGNSESPATGPELSEAQRLAISNPKRDFALARDKGDIHFLAVMGLATDVVGVEGPDEAYLKRVPVKVVEGTSDVLGPKQDKSTREKVREYVRVYNTLVIQHLKEQDKHSK